MFIWWSTHYTSCTFWLTLKLLNLSNDNQIISILSGLSTPCQKEVMAFFWSFRNASGEPGSIRSHLSEPQNPAASKLAWPWPPHGRYDDSRRGGCRGQIDPKSGGFCSKPRWLGHYGHLSGFEVGWRSDVFTQHWRLKWLNHGLGLDVHWPFAAWRPEFAGFRKRGTVGCRSWGLILAVMPAPLLVHPQLMAQ